MIARTVAIALVLLAAGCSFGSDESSAPSEPELASGASLPARCVHRRVPAEATVAFVAKGRAWALDSNGRVICLFSVGAAGPFSWGPRGDRALLAHLQVKGLPGAPSRPPSAVDPAASSWGRPIGKSIVFVSQDGRRLVKAHPAGGPFGNITPVRGATYERVVYHPSGLAFAFVLRRDGRESVWMSTNRGKSPRQLVHGRLHTGFDAIAFGDGGTSLYFAAQHADDRVDIHRLELVGATAAPVAWRGGPAEHVTDLWPGRGQNFALTVGRDCRSSRAMVVTAHRPQGDELLPDAPARALGWLDKGHVLVATGGCGDTLALHSVATQTLKSRLLVRGVDAASVRRPEPYPPPPLSPGVLGARSSFA
jgi:hypothetical protein